MNHLFKPSYILHEGIKEPPNVNNGPKVIDLKRKFELEHKYVIASSNYCPAGPTSIEF